MVAIRETTKVQTISSVQLYPTAECLVEDCPWKSVASRSAKVEAKQHTKETGHDTRSEQVNRAVYRRVAKPPHLNS